MDKNNIITLFQSLLDQIIKENEILIENNSHDNTIKIDINSNYYYRDVIGALCEIIRQDSVYDASTISRVLNSITKYLLYKFTIISIDKYYNDDTTTNDKDIINFNQHDNSIMILSPIMLEILHCVRSIVINHEQYENISSCGICLLLAITTRKFPHLKGYITEILLKSNHLLQLSELSNNMTTALLLSLRMLFFSGSIGSDELRPDLGKILYYAHGNDINVKFQSISFLCELLHFPQSVKIKSLEFLCGKENLSKLIYDDIQISNDYNNDINCSNNNNNNKEINNMKLDISYNEISSKQSIVTGSYGQDTVQICGYDLPIRSNIDDDALLTSRLQSKLIVDTITTNKNLQQLAQSVLLASPVIVQGEVGCGKSFLIRELANALGQSSTLIELNLDDQTDSKSLIGAYVCSDVPGEFLWKPGVITQAATLGHWLVIEDIDKVPLEAIASISSLLERRKLFSPNRAKEVDVHPSFRIFGTRTTNRRLKQSSPTTTTDYDGGQNIVNLCHFSHFFHYVNIEIPNCDEIKTIVHTRYPSLLPILVAQLIETYSIFSLQDTKTKDNSIVKSKTRHFTLRDVMKAASRLSNKSNEYNHTSGLLTSEQLRIALSEIVDVFAASIRDHDSYVEVVYKLGQCWNVNEVEIDTFIINSNPQQSMTINEKSVSKRGEISLKQSNSEEFITVGRVLLPRSSSSIINTEGQQYAFTKHALRQLERIASCVAMDEPVLLVGETGAGKTTSVQELANMTNKKLVVQNLSLSTDTNDLLGGFRPVTMRQLFLPTYEEFVGLFQDTFSSSSNSEFLTVVADSFRKQQWKKLLKAFQKASENALKKLLISKSNNIIGSKTQIQITKWQDLQERIARFTVSLPKIEFGFAFAFVDGLLVDAMKNGYWVLLDEINLASPETLQGLGGILDGQSICLTERGDIGTLKRHPDFRIFAAMNPPTDVGKKELPLSLRCRFTEIYTEEMTDPQDLAIIVSRYLSDTAGAPIDDIVNLYLGCRAASELTLVDSAGQRPRYSLRSLTRSLRASKAFLGNGMKQLNRRLFEGFLLNFQTLLGDASRKSMWHILQHSLKITNTKELSAHLQRPGGKKSNASEWCLIQPFWLMTGSLDPIDWSQKNSAGVTKFVLTKTVDCSIRDLAAAVVANVAPILLQGPTSVGKTTMIEYLAAKTGHKCIRINNHEHTDVQEYIGGYVTNSQGHLEFKDGLLVEALRNGHWIILDELNLAPSDVLEALNRLLDDNKELFIPETGETVKPVRGFTLFATQNPPGVYGGRKPLSRAFRNRFLELSIGDLPFPEVEDIVANSCGIPPKFAKMLVQTMQELQTRRQQSTMFQGKYGSVTTRDLIKWGNRQPTTPLEVAQEGYFLLAERLRSSEERLVIEEILNQVCRVKLETHELYIDNEELDDEKEEDDDDMRNDITEWSGLNDMKNLRDIQTRLREGTVEVEGVRGVAITASMRRMWRLVSRGLATNEPILLIGETGTGKTTLCQLIAAQKGQRIRILNCHQSTETADIIGGLRPVRGREMLLESTITYISEALQIVYLNDVEIHNKVSEETNLFNNSYASGNRIFEEDNIRVVLQDLEKISVVVNWNFNIDNLCDEVYQSDAPTKKAKIEDNVTSQFLIDTNILESPQVKYNSLINNAQETWLRYRALFEWADGPLVTAMKEGDMFILDEINLADDAVIERLNSVLESGRSLTLAEKGGIVSEKIIAHPNFKFLATMNPGGDFGKRELSPALRSRFTEIWVAGTNEIEDIILIVSETLWIDQAKCDNVSTTDVARIMVSFMEWLNVQSSQIQMNGIQISVREVLAWAKFISHWNPQCLSDVYCALLHGAYMIVLDGLGIGISVSRDIIRDLKINCIEHLLSHCPDNVRDIVNTSIAPANSSALQTLSPIDGIFTLGNFSIRAGNIPIKVSAAYVLNAKTTVSNLSRILRAMQLPRPILLEGPPGVGKTSLIANLASLAGHKLIRINLSEHSEISDLLGTDLPISSDDDRYDDEGNEIDIDSTNVTSNNNKFKKNANSALPKFAWSDGVFLTAMKRGDWVLLDELNLAPQSVLEGLNACFDHREEVYLPEIGKSFHCPPTFRVFCAQNPMVEGGGRKGLPQSFLTRFSRVYVESMSEEDMRDIALQVFSNIDDNNNKNEELPDVEMINEVDEILKESQIIIKKLESSKTNLVEYVPLMVEFILRMQHDIVEKSLFGRIGGPWEFNLRDVFRWCELVYNLQKSCCESSGNIEIMMKQIIADAAHILFVRRLRTRDDRAALCMVYFDIFDFSLAVDCNTPIQIIDTSFVLIGMAKVQIMCTPYLASNNGLMSSDSDSYSPLLGNLGKMLESLSHCVALGWPSLLIGQSGSGKRRCIRQLAIQSGHRIVEFSATQSTDSTELLGSFEQVNAYRHLFHGLDEIEKATLILSLPAINTINNDFVVTLSHALTLLCQVQKLILDVSSSNSLQLQSGKDLFVLIQELLVVVWSAKSLISTDEMELNSIDLDGLVISLTEARYYFDKCYQQSSKSENSGFEWVDGIVVNAIKKGYWLVIDNVNLCSASVLDRLNSLLEPNGTLLLTESGKGQVLTPHKHFRIFFTMDPRYGEISRAMRNRCVELSFITEIDNDASALFLQSLNTNTNESLINILSNVYQSMTDEEIKGASSSIAKIPKMRLFSRMNRLIALERSNGKSLYDALLLSYSTIPSLSYSSIKQIIETSHTDQSFKSKSFQKIFKLSPFLTPSISASLLVLTIMCRDDELDIDGSNNIWFNNYIQSIRQRSKSSENLYHDLAVNIYDILSIHDNKVLSYKDRLLLIPDAFSRVIKSCLLEETWGHELITLILEEFESSSSFSNFKTFKFWLQRLLSLPQIKVLLPSSNGNVMSNCSISFSRVFYHSNDGHQHHLMSSMLVSNLDNNTKIDFSLKFIKLWKKLIDCTIFDRFNIMYTEEMARLIVDDLISISADISLPSLFSLSYAVEKGRLIADSKELQMLMAIYSLLMMVDGVVSRIIAFFVTEIANTNSVRFITIEIIDLLQELYRRRDMLSNVLLMTSVVQSQKHYIPWEPVLVCSRWIKKGMKKLTNYILESNNNSENNQFSYESLNKTMEISVREFDRFDKAVSEFWQRPSQFQKIRLWKEGGHTSVPSLSKDWQTLYEIRNIIKPLQKILPNFVETNIEKIDSAALPNNKEVASLLREWICLYSTFYWARTSESYQSNDKKNKTVLEVENENKLRMKQDNMNMGPLVIALTEKFHKFDSNILLNNQLIADNSIELITSHNKDYEDDNDNDELLFDDVIRDRVYREQTQAGELSICIIAESIVIQSLHDISDKLALLLMLQKISSLELQEISELCLKVITISLRYTLFDASNFREIQTLYWCLDAVKSDNSQLPSLLSLSRNILSGIDVKINNITSRNLLNTIASVNFSYSSKTLNNIVNPSKDDSNSHTRSAIQLSWNQALHTSISRQLQPICLETVLKNVDIRAIYPNYTQRGVLSLITHDVASITIQGSHYARPRLLQMFRMLVATSTKKLTQKSIENKVKTFQSPLFSRLNLLCQLTLDIIFSCRDFFHIDFINEMKEIVNLNQDNDKYVIFNKLYLLNIHNLCATNFITSLFTRCLQPVLKTLAMKDIYINPDTNVFEIGLSWVYIGLIRAHLTLPTMPVDPATKAAIKADQLTIQSNIIKSRLNISHMVSSISGNGAITPDMIDGVGNIESINSQVEKLDSRSIQRPAEATPFFEVFFELKGALDSLTNVDRILLLTDKIKSTYESLLINILKSPSKASNLFAELSSLMSEELTWQSSTSAFIERIQNNMTEFEDITSPFLSSLQNISSGLRLLSSWCYGNAEDAISTSSNIGKNQINRAWLTIMQYPHAIFTNLIESNDSFNSNILSRQTCISINDLLSCTDQVVARAYRNLKSAKDSQLDDGKGNKSVPKPETLDSFSPHVILLLALAKIDYHVGGYTSSPTEMYELFQKVLSNFVETHIRGEEETKRIAFEKASLYRNKAQEKSFESNDEKEEEAAFRFHFPDHLKEFKDILNVNEPDQGIDDVNASPIEIEDEDVSSNISQTLDGHTSAELVGYHARMIFVYMSRYMLNSQQMWLKTKTKPTILASAKKIKPVKKSKKQIKEDNLINISIDKQSSLVGQKEFLSQSLCEHSLLVTKTLDWGLKNFSIPLLDSQLKGGSLMSIGIMADKCCYSTSSLSSSNSSWLFNSSSNIRINSKDVDRDFLLLLDHKSKPIDFHADPNPSEVMAATPYLRKLFDRASELLVKFSGNQFLLQVCQLCARIADFHTTTPLGKMLISVELLLKKSDDWEKFAAKHVSLEVEMLGIRTLIAKWRQLELQSWEQLLRCKEVTYSMEALKFWFILAKTLHTPPDVEHFYNSDDEKVHNKSSIENKKILSNWPALANSSPIWLWNKSFNSSTELENALNFLQQQKNAITNANVNPKVTEDSDNDCDKTKDKAIIKPKMDEVMFFAKMFDSLDAFMRSTVVGQYAMRLHLLRLFALQLQQELTLDPKSKDKYEKKFNKNLTNEDKLYKVKVGVATLVFNIWQYYDQFLPAVRKFQDVLKTPLEQRLKEEVKIGKWDQLNAYAVIEHSEKVHRKLNKFIREYQGDVLTFPISAVLRREMMGDLASESGDLIPVNDIPSLSSIFPHLASYGDAIIINTTTVTKPVDESASNNDSNDMNIDNEDEDDKNVTPKVTEVVEDVITIESASEINDCAPLFLEKVIPYNFSNKDIENFIDSESKLVLTQWKNSHPNLFRTKALCLKIDKYLHQSLVAKELVEVDELLKINDNDENIRNNEYIMKFKGKARFGLLCGEISESVCDDIFSRLTSLRAKTVTKTAKQRSIADLINCLRDLGISHLRSMVPAEIRTSVNLMSLAAPLPTEIMSDFTWSSGLPCDIYEKGECYYIKNVAELNQLRIQSVATMSKDISTRDVNLMLGLSENLFCSVLQIRCALSAALLDYREVITIVHQLEKIVLSYTPIEDIDNFTTPIQPSLETLYVMKQSSHKNSSVMLDNLLQLRNLLKTSKLAHNPDMIEVNSGLSYVSSVSIHNVSNKLDKIIDDIDNIVRQAGSTTLIETCTTSSTPFGSLSLSEDLSCSFEWVKNHINTSYTNSIKTLEDFDGITTLLSSLISYDVVDSIKERFQEYCAFYKSSINVLENNNIDDSTLMIEDNLINHNDDIINLLSSCVDNCLIAVQRIRALASTGSNNEISTGTIDTLNFDKDEGANEVSFQDCITNCLLSVSGIQIHKIKDILKDTVKSHSSYKTISEQQRSYILLNNSLPIISRIISTFSILLEDLCQSYKSSGKLLYVSLRIFRNLLAKGICSNNSEEGDGDGEGGAGNRTFEDDCEGTGMGDGDGKKDVSDQIENEEQLLGTKDDKDKDEPTKQQEKKELKEDEVDTGVEMTQDFDGEFFDIPEDKKEEQKDDNDDEEDDTEELDREMGEADEDDIVDEKQWDDEEDGDEPNDQKEEKFEKDSKMEGESLDDEMRTKDDNEQDDSDPNTKEENKDGKEDKDNNDDQDNDNEDEKINEDKEENKSEKPQGVQVRNEEDDEEDDNSSEVGDEGADKEPENADELPGDDLPDNMKLDDGEEGNDNDENGSDVDEDNINDEDNKDGDDKMEEDKDDEEEKSDNEDDDKNLMTSKGGNINDIQQDEEEKEEDKQEEDDEEDEEDNDDKEAKIDANKDEKKTPKPDAYGVKATTSDESVLGTEEDNADKNEDIDDKSKEVDSTGPKGKGGSSSESQGQDGESIEMGHRNNNDDNNKIENKEKREMEPPNPFKQKGDVNEAWHRRLNLLENSENPVIDENDDDNKDCNEKNNENSKDDNGLFEHAEKDDDIGEQVLAPTTEDEAVQLPNDNNDKEKKNQDLEDKNTIMEEGEDESKKKEQKKRDRQNDTSNNRKKRKEENEDKEAFEPFTSNNLDEDNEDDDIDINSIDEMEEEDNDDNDDNNEDDKDRGGKVFYNPKFKISDFKEQENDDAKYEDKICVEYDYATEHLDMETARNKWVQHKITTESHAIRLCEQLRLILEPTLATRLKGDYRTGKRINMRRVISYVASGFRKDKIWLRRNKPAKRDYQVMVMIDNSSSMKTAGPLALSALTTISSALTRLEVGEMCVTSFATDVKVVHPFGKPFNDEAGAQIFSNFDFNDDKTLLGASLNAVAPVFENARSIGGNGGNRQGLAMQLCFVISDARLDSDNREQLDNIVRTLAEQHVLVVLIIIDDTGKDSIFNTKTVEFRGDRVVTTSYLDNFPFPYYVAIQKVEALPDVLSDALKQWFEIVNSQLEN